MARKLPPPHPKGAPKTPGWGRQKGTPNRKTVELRILMGAPADDPRYQAKLREDFIKRRLHPSTEIRVWEYHLGRPLQQVEMTANVALDRTLW